MEKWLDKWKTNKQYRRQNGDITQEKKLKQVIKKDIMNNFI